MAESKRSSKISSLVDRLRGALPRGVVIDDPLQLPLYGYDGTFYAGEPELVILPENGEQASRAVGACWESEVPIVPRGAATSLSGGPVPLRGGAVVSFARMDRVLSLDYANQRAVVQPGVVNLDFQNLLAKEGFFYAPDPSSQSVCTLGGNVGENSGGPHCLKYGVTANHVLALEMILPDGRTMRLSRDDPGYDLMGVVVGSEGTFGLVTEITCRLTPLPETVVTMLAVFDSLDDASRSVSDIISDGIIPATLEMMDKAMIQAVEKGLHAGYPLDAEAVLIVEVDGLTTGIAKQVGQVEAACRRNAVRSFQVARDAQERALLWKGRKGAFGAVVHILPNKICTDISVPRSELPKVLAGVTQIAAKWNIPIANVFHAGDGNLHPLVLFDPRDEDQLRRAKAADEDISQLALKFGGVLTGEHGIGCGKRKYMTQAFGPSELALMWKIKDVFDPKGLCNPDKVLPEKSDMSGELDRSGGSDGLEAVRTALAQAHHDGKCIVLRGAGTKSELWDNILDLSGLNRIVSYDYENLTITVECGVTLSAIDEALKARNQMLPIRPRFASRATIGGVIATDDSGPHRLLYGGPRDVMIGIKAALPNGEIVRFGSSCVKNVAGYAVEKLFVGSHGTLGAILEATLRTLPRPEVFATRLLSLNDPRSANMFFKKLFRSKMRPAAVELLNPAGMRLIGEEGNWGLLIGLEGLTDDLIGMTRRLDEMASEEGLGRWIEVDWDYFDLWNRVTDLQAGSPMFKASCHPSEAIDITFNLSTLDGQMPVRASLGLGQVYCGVSKDFGEFQNRAMNVGAIASWLGSAPMGLSARCDEVVLDVNRRLKKAFDPNGVLPFLL